MLILKNKMRIFECYIISQYKPILVFKSTKRHTTLRILLQIASIKPSKIKSFSKDVTNN